MRTTLPRRRLAPGILTALLLVGSACQSPEEPQSAPTNQLRSAPTSQTVPLPQTSTTETTATTTATTTTMPAPPEGLYSAEGFSLRTPENWKTIDRQSIVDGSIAEGVPEGLTSAITQEVTKVFDSGVLVAFYQFDNEARYTPNITVSRLTPQPETDTSTQAANTVTELEQQGFLDVSTSVGSSATGTVVEVRYTVPQARTGFPKDIFASSHVIFGAGGTWTVTGLTSGSSESIDRTVASITRSLSET